MSTTTHGLTSDELDELYSLLSAGLTGAAEEGTPMILARLCLLLMHEVGDHDRVRAAIEEALAAW